MTHSNHRFGSLWLLAVCFVVAGSHIARAERPVVATTVFPIQSLVAQITGPDIRVDGIIPPNRSPHAYQPTDEDIAEVNRADLLICIGLGLDEWAVTLAEEKRTPVVVLAELLSEPPGADPHLWMDPMLMANAVTLLQKELAKRFPSHSPTISMGVRRTVDSLFALDAWISAQLSPFIGSAFVSQHDAFGRLARRYGLAVIDVLLEDPAGEPSPAHLADVADKLKKFSRRVVFYYPQFDRHPAQEVADRADARLVELDPEGHPRAPGRENYFHLMRYNVRQMVTAFQAKE
jgi:zinc transport system substrate-binding protein